MNKFSKFCYFVGGIFATIVVISVGYVELNKFTQTEDISTECQELTTCLRGRSQILKTNECAIVFKCSPNAIDEPCMINSSSAPELKKYFDICQNIKAGLYPDCRLDGSRGGAESKNNFTN